MGAMQNNTKNGKRRKGGSSRRRPVEPADWSEADGGLIIHLVEVVTKRQGAVRFGLSRDGGAYAVGLYDDGDNWTEYLSGSQSPDDWLRRLASEFSGGDD